ncbi:DNA primase, partial [Candidatus Woesearchaeota archaeon]
ATSVAEIDFVVKAPDGKEVEEITKKEIHKALRGKVAAEQAKMDIKDVPKKPVLTKRTQYQQRTAPAQNYQRRNLQRTAPVKREEKSKLTKEQKEKFKQLLDDLVGTRGAYLLDEKLNILGKVPTTELESTIKSMSTGLFAVVFDGEITKEIVARAQRAKTKFVVGMESKIKASVPDVTILTSKDF